jgi:cysteine sulfinate desulfinase/cysteine desulfurase-like protein
MTDKNNLIRFSWGAYTTKEEIDFAFEKIGEVSARISKFV